MKVVLSWFNLPVYACTALRHSAKAAAQHKLFQNLIKGLQS